jgi:hypothetical protein
MSSVFVASQSCFFFLRSREQIRKVESKFNDEWPTWKFISGNVSSKLKRQLFEILERADVAKDKVWIQIWFQNKIWNGKSALKIIWNRL